MMFTDRALAAQIITREEADTLEDWIDASLVEGEAVTVPPHLHNLWSRVFTFTFADGVKQ